jgi:ABC-2 type transport system ATP-binding protein
MAMTSAAIEIDGLTKDYALGFWRKRMRRSLDNLSLRVDDGEIFGFLGPNGAGKTTTLKLLMGLIFPTAGTARIRGKSIGDVAMHREIGYLPEQPYFYDYLTARELLDYYARFFGFAATDRRERVARFLELVGLTAAADVQLRKFSKGMLQRAGIAQAILHDPKVVFLDEPMSGLDPIGRREVRDIILDLKNQGRTVFFSTHILSDAEMLCDRVAVLVDGKLQGVGAPGEIVSMDVVAMDILFELKEGRALPQALAAFTTKAGAHYRAEVPEADLYTTLEKLRDCDARILSVQPVRPSLEEYFFRMVNREKAASHAVEVLAR